MSTQRRFPNTMFGKYLRHLKRVKNCIVRLDVLKVLENIIKEIGRTPSTIKIHVHNKRLASVRINIMRSQRVAGDPNLCISKGLVKVTPAQSVETIAMADLPPHAS